VEGFKLVDEKLSDEEIRELWAEHFPRWLNDIKSKTLCEVFRLVVERRSRLLAATGRNR
jgi:hypothetical protein